MKLYEIKDVSVPVIPMMTEAEKIEMFASMPKSSELPTMEDLALNESADLDFIEV